MNTTERTIAEQVKPRHRSNAAIPTPTQSRSAGKACTSRTNDVQTQVVCCTSPCCSHYNPSRMELNACKENGCRYGVSRHNSISQWQPQPHSNVIISHCRECPNLPPPASRFHPSPSILLQFAWLWSRRIRVHSGRNSGRALCSPDHVKVCNYPLPASEHHHDAPLERLTSSREHAVYGHEPISREHMPFSSCSMISQLLDYLQSHIRRLLFKPLFFVGFRKQQTIHYGFCTWSSRVEHSFKKVMLPQVNYLSATCDLVF